MSPKPSAVLSGDDAHVLFPRNFNPALLQIGAIAKSERREEASRVLSIVAQKFHDPRLSNLAGQVNLDAFTRVKKDIDDMIAHGFLHR